MKDYVPNEKYHNMFGVQRRGYGMESVDLYLAQLEVAFKKIREDNRALKRELVNREGGAAFLPGDALTAPQDHYIAQLQQQFAAEQAKTRQLQEQLHAVAAPADTGELHGQLQAAHNEIDYLRHQLSQQPVDNTNHYEQDMQCIAKALVDARRQADDTLRCAEQDARRIAAEITGKAEQEAEAMLQKARRRAEELKTERDRIFSQLQGISYTVRNVLREANEPLEFQQLYQARQAQADHRLREPNYRQAR
jgi:vacuolar-type H+-ATPase subunit H